MIYNIGDKFLIEGVIGEVKYINNYIAWLFPTQDAEKNEEFYKGQKLLTGCAFTKLDSRGRTPEGKKALTVVNKDCQAV